MGVTPQTSHSVCSAQLQHQHQHTTDHVDEPAGASRGRPNRPQRACGSSTRVASCLVQSLYPCPLPSPRHERQACTHTAAGPHLPMTCMHAGVSGTRKHVPRAFTAPRSSCGTFAHPAQAVMQQQGFRAINHEKCCGLVTELLPVSKSSKVDRSG